MIVTFFQPEADISEPSARAASRHQKQGTIARSVRSLGGTLTLTCRLDALIADTQSLMP